MGIEIINDEAQHNHRQRHNHNRTGILKTDKDCQKPQQQADGIHNQYRLSLAEAMVNQLMMQMSSVRLHDGLIFRHTAQHCTNRIKHRQSNTKHAHNQRKQGIALEYAEDTRYRKHKAKERRACIAHKDFRRVEVSGKEAQTGPCQCRR